MQSCQLHDASSIQAPAILAWAGSFVGLFVGDAEVRWTYAGTFWPCRAIFNEDKASEFLQTKKGIELMRAAAHMGQ